MTDGRLIDFIEQVSGGTHLRVEENFGNGFVRLRSEEAERRQAKHDIRQVEDIVIEMLRNARDAGAKDIYIATTKEGSRRLITIIDDGDGIPPELQSLIFEPRVTSKLETMLEDDWGVHGRGMALFSIKSNVTSAAVVASGVGLGASIFVDIDTDLLSEKTDQSTFPEIVKDEDGNLKATKGPHNILRTSLEFALKHRKSPNVFIGTPSAIAKTLMERGSRQMTNDDLLFCNDVNELPVSRRLAVSTDAADLMANCAAIGLDISERTAHRILSGQIAAVSPLYEMAKGERSRQAKLDLIKDNRGLRLAKDDVEAFSREMEKAFELLAQRYYLSLTDVPRVSVKGDAITVRFQIEKE
ncbi:MAG TPA: ATP-binding protein [Coriobacteriia bacterium]|nr:ATP-binding protein [Coriobacteriia bacterium]